LKFLNKLKSDRQDLINNLNENIVSLEKIAYEQQAEIERLQEENKNHKAVIEAIEDTINPLPFETDFDKAIKTAKTEAIKEFAERLKEKAMQKFDWNEYVEVEEIDNLVKEMVGDDNG
jgi:archaellum component FlaC